METTKTINSSIISVDNLYTGKYMISCLDTIPIESGIKFIGCNTISSHGLRNHKTGEILYDVNAGKDMYSYLITENKAKKLGLI